MTRFVAPSPTPWSMSPASHRQPEPMQIDNKPLVLSNARLVLADRVIEAGWVAIEDGMIADLGADHPPAGAEDVACDFIIPGLIELHTDHIEAHFMPRPKVYWDPLAAVVSYDAQLARCGISTVLDSLRVWREEGADQIGGEASVFATAPPTPPQPHLPPPHPFIPSPS